ncbi:MAG: hypothetical protein ACJAYR_002083 [Sneathiella sp.]
MFVGNSEKPDTANQNIFEHNPVPEKTVKGILESGRSILLKEEMSDPGKSISNNGQPP